MSVLSDSRKVPLLRLFGQLLIRPGGGVAAILDFSPSVTAIALALIPVGLLRGAVEGLWYYLMTGQGQRVLTLLADADWYTRYGGPFLVLNIPSAHFLWLLTAVLLHLLARWLGGRGAIRQTLQVTGIGMFSYLLIGLLNYLHLGLRLPSVTLHASAFYQPNLGVGQLLILGWIILLCFHAGRQVYGLSGLSALLMAPLPVLISLLLYLGSAALFFGLISAVPGRPAPTEWLGLANWAYLGSVLVLSALMGLWAQRRLKAGDLS